MNDIERRGGTGSDDTDGASEPGVPTPHPGWVRAVTVVVLAAFVLAVLVAALL